MNTPMPRGTPVSPERITAWLGRFRFYRHPPDEEAIHRWFARFAKPDRDIAARVLDSVHIVSDQQILQGYRDALRQLKSKGWSFDPSRRKGRWLFVGFGHSGESGQAMLRSFREANQLTSAAHNPLFCGASDLPYKKLTGEDHVVFIDDFSGSGRQVCMAWPTVQELVASDATCHLILTAATQNAIAAIRTSAGLTPIVYVILRQEDNIFESQCKHFNASEKSALVRYGKRADRKHPKGYGDCGLLFVLSHKTPNNTIPVLHAYHNRWKGLFPRYVPLPG